MADIGFILAGCGTMALAMASFDLLLTPGRRLSLHSAPLLRTAGPALEADEPALEAPMHIVATEERRSQSLPFVGRERRTAEGEEARSDETAA